MVRFLLLLCVVTAAGCSGPGGAGLILKNAAVYTMEEALKAYTINAARAEFDGDARGSLKAGKLADLIVLDRNLLEIDPREILETKTPMTIVDWRVVYEAPLLFRAAEGPDVGREVVIESDGLGAQPLDDFGEAVFAVKLLAGVFAEVKECGRRAVRGEMKLPATVADAPQIRRFQVPAPTVIVEEFVGAAGSVP